MEVYGPVGPSAGPYMVDVDGRAVGSYNDSRGRFSPRTALYHETGLSPGEHKMQIANLPYSRQTI